MKGAATAADRRAKRQGDDAGVAPAAGALSTEGQSSFDQQATGGRRDAQRLHRRVDRLRQPRVLDRLPGVADREARRCALVGLRRGRGGRGRGGRGWCWRRRLSVWVNGPAWSGGLGPSPTDQPVSTTKSSSSRSPASVRSPRPIGRRQQPRAAAGRRIDVVAKAAVPLAHARRSRRTVRKSAYSKPPVDSPSRGSGRHQEDGERVTGAAVRLA